MGRRSSCPFSVILILGMAILGCRRQAGSVVNVVGSTSIQPFAEMLGEEYGRLHPGQTVDVQGGGSTAGLQAVQEAIADIGTCSRALKPEETGYTPIVIARDGLAIVVHPSNTITGLEREQIRRMFAGELLNWKEVGGDDRVIRLITREEGSGTREAFCKLVMGDSRISRKALTQESNGAVKELVKGDRCGIGYMSFGLVGTELKILDVDHVIPSRDSVRSGEYPLVRPFLLVTRGSLNPQSQAFLDYVLSDEAQALLEKEGLARAQGGGP